MAMTTTLGAKPTVTTVNDNQYIPVTDGSGVVEKISIADLRSAILQGYDISTIRGHNVVNGVMYMGHFSNLAAALEEAANSRICGARNVFAICFTYTGAAGKVSSFILQSVRGDDVCIQYIFDRGDVNIRSITGATGGDNGTAAYNESPSWANSLAVSGNVLKLMSYEQFGQSAKVLSQVTLP